MTMDDLWDVSKIDLPLTEEEEAFLRETMDSGMKLTHELQIKGGIDAEFAVVAARGISIYCRLLKTLAKARDEAMQYVPH